MNCSLGNYEQHSAGIQTRKSWQGQVSLNKIGCSEHTVKSVKITKSQAFCLSCCKSNTSGKKSK